MVINPYALSFINLSLSFLLFLGVFLYKFVYPKKKINLFFLLILISLIPIWSIFRPGVYESGDFNIHIYRSIEFYKSLSEGIFMPSWAADLNATYGYPLFSFNYTLPYYLISFFHLLGFSFILSMKVFLATNLLFSGIFMFFAANNYFKDKLAAFTSSIFYIFTPYHLISIHFKITIGEILAFTILPLVFLFLTKFLQKPNIRYLLFCGMSLGLLALSHIYIAIIFIPFLFAYCLYVLKSKTKAIIYATSITLLAAVISIYQWSSSIIYYNYLFVKAHPPDISKLYYPNFLDFLYSPWRFGLLFQGPKGQLSFLIGYAQIIVIIFILYKILKNNTQPKIKKEIIFWLIMFFITLISITPITKFFWERISFLGYAGTQRLLLLVCFITSFLAGFVVFLKIQKFRLYCLISFAILSTILNWGQRTLIPNINDKSLIANLPYSTSGGEGHFYANTKWVDPKQLWFSKIPNNHLEILNGEATIKDLSRSLTDHQYLIDAKTPIGIRENTLYFPGWSLKSNGKLIKLQTDKRGVIIAKLPAGLQKIELKYDDLFLFKLSKIISASSIFIILFLGFIYTLQNYSKLQRRK